MLKLRYVPDPILKERMPHRSRFPLWLVGDMMSLMLKSKGAGLAAPQVGVPLRLFVTMWGDVFFNPIVDAVASDQWIDYEGCLSMPGAALKVKRPIWIEIDGVRYTGIQGRVIQHELDHLNGIVISDYPQPPSNPARRMGGPTSYPDDQSGIRLPVHRDWSI